MLINKIAQNVIGQYQLFTTPFGQLPMIYADYTASGRGLQFIEEYIQHQVLPWYANTHTETSYTGSQTTYLREQARETIKNALNATEQDKVIFCGSGATAAINKLIDILNLRIPHDLKIKYKLEELISEDLRPVVFVGPYEHHSNELPWRESIATVVRIPMDEQGKISLSELKKQLEKYEDRHLKIGSFSAASNVTGIKSDIERISQVLKENGAMVFWDYAAAGPYVNINMNGKYPIDAAFISPHKFVGGPGTPGVLVVKQSVMKNKVPAVVGGGTVSYVTPISHTFIQDPERREEGGTPAIIESIRAGLVFKLQSEVGTDKIETLESEAVSKAMQRFSAIDNLEVLGPKDAERLAIFSLRFTHQGQDLHYGFVTALLNDLFGIQVRGGCSCAGPYGHTLLNMDSEYSAQIEEQIQQGEMLLRPGWVRLNFNYFIDAAEFDYILEAIELVANHGWRMLPFYCADKSTGVWRFQKQLPKHVSSLSNFTFEDMQNTPSSAQKPDFQNLLENAKQIFLAEHPQWQTYSVELGADADALRWFYTHPPLKEVG